MCDNGVNSNLTEPLGKWTEVLFLCTEVKYCSSVLWNIDAWNLENKHQDTVTRTCNV